MKQDIATLASTTMRVSFAILALTAAMATEATDVAAQSTPFADCGKECYQCGPGGLQMEGRGSSPTGAYDMNCPDEPSNTCSRDACSSAFMSVAEVGPGDLEVLATLRDAPLVSRIGNSFAVAFEGFQNVVCGLRPDEGLGVLVVDGQVVLDGLPRVPGCFGSFRAGSACS